MKVTWTESDCLSVATFEFQGKFYSYAWNPHTAVKRSDNCEFFVSHLSFEYINHLIESYEKGFDILSAKRDSSIDKMMDIMLDDGFGCDCVDGDALKSCLDSFQLCVENKLDYDGYNFSMQDVLSYVRELRKILSC